MVLRGRGSSVSDTKLALVALHEALNLNKVKEVNTLGTHLLALQCDLEERHHLSYFDSLIAASASTLDRVPRLRRWIVYWCRMTVRSKKFQT